MDKTLSIIFTSPMNSYLEEELSNRYNLIKLYEIPIQKQQEFLRTHSDSIRAIVADYNIGVNAEIIEMLPKLEIVAAYSVGMDKFDLEKCKENGIKVTNTPDVLTDDVADLAIGLAISVMRRICEADRYVKSGLWKLKANFDLTSKFSGKRVGIIGLGRIGRAIATRVEAFDCPISYYSKTPKPNSYKYCPTVLELASNSDILIVACSLTSETHHIINKEVIDALGPKGVLINIGRGLHVNEPELVKALVEGRLGGAGLDVFEDEPHVPEELLGLDNVVLSPHAGSATMETRKVMADLVLGNLEAFFSEKPLLTPVV